MDSSSRSLSGIAAGGFFVQKISPFGLTFSFFCTTTYCVREMKKGWQREFFVQKFVTPCPRGGVEMMYSMSIAYTCTSVRGCPGRNCTGCTSAIAVLVEPAVEKPQLGTTLSCCTTVYVRSTALRLGRDRSNQARCRNCNSEVSHYSFPKVEVHTPPFAFVSVLHVRF